MFSLRNLPRLGDLITVGDVTGRVAMQRLRTTVLSDEEGREVIVPNQNFVNEDVTNWMGAGRLSVLAMEVSVTRERRPADLCRELYELMRDHPDVLISPAPQATLVCVGKHTQRIELRAWVEQNARASRQRDALLKVVNGYLRDERLLTSQQPRQPDMQDSLPDLDDLPRPRKNRRRRPA